MESLGVLLLNEGRNVVDHANKLKIFAYLKRDGK